MHCWQPREYTGFDSIHDIARTRACRLSTVLEMVFSVESVDM